MKKLLYLLAAVVCLLTLSSCEGDNYYPKETSYVYQYNKENLDLHVESADWQWSEDGYFYYTFEVKELTKEIYNYGVALCYREYNHGRSDAYQIALPYIHTLVDGTTPYQQYIDFSYLPNQVEVAVTNSDLKYDATQNPESMDFHLTLIW